MTNFDDVLDVDLPDDWDDYPRDAKIRYLTTDVKRPALFDGVADAAGFRPKSDAYAQRVFHKDELAQLLFTLLDGDGDD